MASGVTQWLVYLCSGVILFLLLQFVILEYVLLAGVNDSLADAHRLVTLTQNIYCMVGAPLAYVATASDMLLHKARCVHACMPSRTGCTCPT